MTLLLILWCALVAPLVVEFFILLWRPTRGYDQMDAQEESRSWSENLPDFGDGHGKADYEDLRFAEKLATRWSGWILSRQRQRAHAKREGLRPAGVQEGQSRPGREPEDRRESESGSSPPGHPGPDGVR